VRVWGERIWLKFFIFPEFIADYSLVVNSTNKDIYEVVLPFILHHLCQPKDAKSLADSLKVRKIQMDDWLKRAMEEGTVRKLDKSSVYVLNQADTQLSLL